MTTHHARQQDQAPAPVRPHAQDPDWIRRVARTSAYPLFWDRWADSVEAEQKRGKHSAD